MIGRLIKSVRIQRNLSQQKLGELCGYKGGSARVMVQKWEKEIAPIPLDKIRPLARALGLTVDEFVP